MANVDKNKHLDGYGLTALLSSLKTFFSMEGNQINADTLDGKHLSELSLDGHTHSVVNGYQITVSTSAPPSGTSNNVITFVK